MTSSDSNPYSRYLAVLHSSNGVSLTFGPTAELTLGSRRRAIEARWRVAGLLRRRRFKTSTQGEAICTTIAPQDIDELSDLLAVDAALDAFRQERLRPRVVEEILGITSRERRRWTKDGRLPQSGSGSFRRGRRSIRPQKSRRWLGSPRQSTRAATKTRTHDRLYTSAAINYLLTQYRIRRLDVVVTVSRITR
ncbi:hypothetical protein J4G43_015050 [Bradyrhizobium barranii subsp. barranii]|uniref:Uncharacterized protein n=1 Tax=Bradyrhizobium barranii subsp. barranii TaxID=2823807 RepID=A0A939M3Y4_9BRAD|nr:hypothetical protein [Bradyrhizobium barranii]UEM15412.1 hypothetical protein J4G43_015050 [Bradyrhizobium barranii subsp. barranii]